MNKKPTLRREALGSWRTLPSGKWEYRISYTDEYSNKKQKSFTGVTREECKERAEIWTEELEHRKEFFNEDVTIVDLLEHKYKIDYKMNYTGEQGYGRNLDTLERLRKHIIGRIPVRRVRKSQIQDYLSKLTGYSASTINKFYIQLKLGFRIAHENGIIERNPMNDVDLRCPKSAKPKKKVMALTIEEQKKLVDFLSDKPYRFGANDYRLQIMIELYSGMRMGEINALHPKDIDLENDVIHVRHTISRGIDFKDFVKDGTKTPNGKRDIPISSLLRPYVEEALRQYKPNKHGLLFYDHKHDSLISSDQVNHSFKCMCGRLGIPKRGQHSLRHTFATRCIESGVQPIVLKTWLGHRDIHTTLDTYTDVFRNLDDSSINVLDAYLEKI